MKKNFSNVFKDLRKQREMTQEQIAEVLGVSCQAISKWETNSSYPDISLLPDKKPQAPQRSAPASFHVAFSNP